MEKSYTVYFEFYSKKMKATVIAENEDEAKKIVASKITFHAVKVDKNDLNKAVDLFEEMMDMLGAKKT